jgi:hypothetical protein
VASSLIVLSVALSMPSGTTLAASRISSLTHKERVAGVALADGRLRTAVDDVRHGRSRHLNDGVRVRGDLVQVEIVHRLTEPAARSMVVRVGGRVSGSNGSNLVEAWVPADQLEAIEALPEVVTVRVPLDVGAPESANAASGSKGVEAVTKTAAAAWHADGITGAKVKIGVVDTFDGAAWTKAMATGDTVAPAATFCLNQGTACAIWSGGIVHGVGVGEVLHDMAPGSPLYLASVRSTSDLKAAIDWFASNGVRVISRSLTAVYDGPGDGTGPLDSVVDYAVSKGMVWFNSAGNSAGVSSEPGAYWRGTWRDDNGNGWLDFGPGDELMGFDCAFINGFRWSDWGLDRTDYDVYVFDDPVGTVLDSKSDVDQTAGGDPIELPLPKCSSASDVDYLAVKLYSPGAGTAGDVLEFMTNGDAVEYPQNAYSATAPVVDSASVGLIAVGAVDPWRGSTIGVYSSQGPTNDGRIKPDLSAASCVSSVSYTPGCFNGTSAATPVAAGAAALVLSAWPDSTPAQLKHWLQTAAVVDRGTAGADNVFGAGELVLPAPPDVVAPKVTAPKAVVATGRTLGATTVPVTLSWSATDPSGVKEFALFRQVNGGAWTEIALPSAIAHSLPLTLNVGTTYRFTVAARDGAGNWSKYVDGPAFAVRTVGETSLSIVYSTGWTRTTWTRALGGALKVASKPSASATFKVVGRGVTWVATKAASRGAARVYVDGVLKATVNLYAATTQPRLAVFSTTWAARGTHTVKIVVLGTADRPTVDVDAFAVMS